MPTAFNLIRGRGWPGIISEMAQLPSGETGAVRISRNVGWLHRSARQTLASRKFNEFIDLLIRQIYPWSFGNNQRKFDPPWPWPLCLQDHTSHTEKNQFTNRKTSSCRQFR
jgi:hypothetical protein